MLKPFHIAVFSVEVMAPEQEGAFSAEVIFTTQFEVSHPAMLCHLSSLWLLIRPCNMWLLMVM